MAGDMGGRREQRRRFRSRLQLENGKLSETAESAYGAYTTHELPYFLGRRIFYGLDILGAVYFHPPHVAFRIDGKAVSSEAFFIYFFY